MNLLSDAGQISVWPTIKKHLTEGQGLYFSHGFGITFHTQTDIIPPNIEGILDAEVEEVGLSGFVSGPVAKFFQQN